jgi:hypothetical protein
MALRLAAKEKNLTMQPPTWMGTKVHVPLPRQDWQPTPKDDAWRQAHLAMLDGLGKDAWRGCDACAHSVMVRPREFAERHDLDTLTPLLTISKRLRCTRFGARKGGCRPESHDTRKGI